MLEYVEEWAFDTAAPEYAYASEVADLVADLEGIQASGMSFSTAFELACLG